MAEIEHLSLLTELNCEFPKGLVQSLLVVMSVKLLLSHLILPCLSGLLTEMLDPMKPRGVGKHVYIFQLNMYSVSQKKMGPRFWIKIDLKFLI